MQSVVRMHPVRANQLEKFASKNSMTVPRLIDWFVRILIDNGEIDDQIEEFTLDCDKDQNVARITLAGHQLPEISLLHASKLVLDLFDFAKDPSTPVWHEISGTQVLTAHRSGHGVRISLREGQKVLAGLSLSIPILVDVLRGFHHRLSAAGV